MLTEKLLSVENLSISIGEGELARPLLSNVTFAVRPKSVLGIIGESGSGKTLLSRALVNWVRPPLRVTSGRVIYRERDLLSMSESEIGTLRGREIAYVGSNPTTALDPTVPVGHQIEEKLRAIDPGLPREQTRKRVIDLLDAVRIPSARARFDEYPFQFSGGMMQRAMIVDALISNPKLLVADNITQPLDVTVAAQILRLLRDLQTDFGTSIVFVSSSFGTIVDIADDVVVLDKGTVVEAQETRAIQHSPEHPYTKELLAKVPRLWHQVGNIPVPNSDPVVLDVRDVAKTYEVKDRKSLFKKNRVQAVRGVSFEIRRGESLGLIGESGCGKSTLSRLLSSLEAPDRGEIKIDGVDVATLRGEALLGMRRRFQLLLQDPYNSIPSHVSIGATIAEPLRIHGLASSRDLRQRVYDAMAEVGLSSDLYDSLPVGLSAGQRQRVNIARAMVLKPSVLILDETLSALDQVEQAKLLDLFDDLQRKHGITYLYISHDLAMVRRACAKIAVMYLGRIVELGDNATIFDNPAHPYTRTLLSSVSTVEAKPFLPSDYLLEGEPPDPIQIPSGCSFQSRCPFVVETCRRQDPLLEARSDWDAAACHLGLEDLPAASIEKQPSLGGLLETANNSVERL
ncbi:ABC transporter ATP-binding protein [Pseudorhizobium flavum]|uniref:Peptide/nickel transport system ATP-binding protein n=1 Tax=Pseudorhizobium flavum TaxID=1335061 RepID=A0A7W9Z1C9_9HYPH|nr:ABC transporter ATP-binding protein [Pseudorhizobium flavum]MBB6182244.1 peptide/nickel transport system ATP-binding protein [Pseudorhizobium flavum]CAD6629335.1 ABC transporter ATP-binding protein [Pseudorhizobium flavum]